MTEATEVENAMYELADKACRALGVDPDKVEDPVGPVTARENVIYAMYKHAENIEASRQSSGPVQGDQQLGLIAQGKARWIERWYGSDPKKGSAIVTEDRSEIAVLGGNEETHKQVRKIVMAHNAALAAPTGRERVLLEALKAARQIITDIDDYMKEPDRGDWGVECALCMGELLDDDRQAIASIDAAIAQAQETE